MIILINHLACVIHFAPALLSNGPAIKFVFGAESTGVPSAGFIVFITVFTKAVGREAWRNFCRPGINWLAFWRDRGAKFLSGRNWVTVQECDKWALAQCRAVSPDRNRRWASWGVILVEASIESRYRSFRAGRWACPGLSFSVIFVNSKKPAKIATKKWILLSVLVFRDVKNWSF